VAVTRRDFLRILTASACAAAVVPAIPHLRRIGHAQENLDALLEPIRAQHQMPALGAAFVRGKEVVALGVVGRRRSDEPEPARQNDRWHLGSCTKAMTATLLAVLVEQGKLKWDSTIAEVFPDLAQRLRTEYLQLTPVHFLSHRSGLPVDTSANHPLAAPLWGFARTLTGPLMEQRRKLLEFALSRPPASEPGRKSEYSNIGYAVAGAFAEKVAGQSWETLMRELVFQPLGMSTPGYGAPGFGAPWGHGPNFCEPIPPGPNADNPLVIGPAGTVHASLSDWASFASLHLLGARGEAGLLLKQESFEWLHRDVFQQNYALGWGLARRDWTEGPALTHLGSNRRWYSRIWIAPAKSAALLSVTNCGSQNGLSACDAAVTAMVRRFL